LVNLSFGSRPRFIAPAPFAAPVFSGYSFSPAPIVQTYGGCQGGVSFGAQSYSPAPRVFESYGNGNGFFPQGAAPPAPASASAYAATNGNGNYEILAAIQRIELRLQALESRPGR